MTDLLHVLYRDYSVSLFVNLLGHKDVSTTYGIYIHMVPQELDEAAEAIGKVMLGG